MSHYSIALLTPGTDAWIPAYVGAVGPLVEKHGGRYLLRTADFELLEGEGGPAMVVVLEWPSKAAERAFYDDPAYAPHLAARKAGATTTFYSVAGQDDLG